MTINEELILKEVEGYSISYKAKFGERPRSWFTYLQWLARVYLSAGNFNYLEISLADRLLQELANNDTKEEMK